MKPRALLLETIHADAHTQLEEWAHVHLIPTSESAPPPDELAAADVIFTRGRGRVPAALLDGAPRVRIVARSGVGLDNVDVAAATERGIAVINAPGSTTLSVAEHTIMLLLAASRKLDEYARASREDRWEARLGYDGDEIAEKTLGIVGFGSIGARVARLAEAFDLRVIYWSRSPKDVPYEFMELEDLLARSDFVSLHTALTPETREMMGPDLLRAMKPGAILVNTARGALVDRTALREALDSGALSAYAADGHEPEPPEPHDAILTHPRALVTPHCAALTDATYRRMCVRTVANVRAYLSGEAIEEGCLFNAETLNHRR